MFLWHQQNRNEGIARAIRAGQAKRLNVIGRWLEKIKKLIPKELTTKQKIIIAKLIAKEVELAYHKGYNKGMINSMHYK